MSATQPLVESGVLSDTRMAWLNAYANDLAVSIDFYRNSLGLPLLYSDDGVALFDAGAVVLALRPAKEDGIRLVGRRDEANDTVFLVDDIELVRAALERRGVTFFRNRTYEVGRVTDFYDPNGHRLMLYEPSREALTWPSAGKIRAVWRAAGRGRSDLIGPPSIERAESAVEVERSGLHGKPLVYLFMFIDDPGRALGFYQSALGLHAIERTHCCNQSCPDEETGEEEGIVKYDVGGVLLTTHHLHEGHVVLDDQGRPYSPRELKPENIKGIAPVFLVPDVYRAAAALRERGVRVQPDVKESWTGRTIVFEDSCGHLFHIHETSSQAAALPSGAKVDAVLAASL